LHKLIKGPSCITRQQTLERNWCAQENFIHPLVASKEYIQEEKENERQADLASKNEFDMLQVHSITAILM
jgi:hypothetical protein